MLDQVTPVQTSPVSSRQPLTANKVSKQHNARTPVSRRSTSYSLTSFASDYLEVRRRPTLQSNEPCRCLPLVTLARQQQAHLQPGLGTSRSGVALMTTTTILLENTWCSFHQTRLSLVANPTRMVWSKPVVTNRPI